MKKDYGIKKREIPLLTTILLPLLLNEPFPDVVKFSSCRLYWNHTSGDRPTVRIPICFLQSEGAAAAEGSKACLRIRLSQGRDQGFQVSRFAAFGGIIHGDGRSQPAGDWDDPGAQNGQHDKTLQPSFTGAFAERGCGNRQGNQSDKRSTDTV